MSAKVNRSVAVARASKFHGLFAAQSQQESNAECQRWLEGVSLISFCVPVKPLLSSKPQLTGRLRPTRLTGVRDFGGLWNDNGEKSGMWSEVLGLQMGFPSVSKNQQVCSTVLQNSVASLLLKAKSSRCQTNKQILNAAWAMTVGYDLANSIQLQIFWNLSSSSDRAKHICT